MQRAGLSTILVAAGSALVLLVGGGLRLAEHGSRLGGGWRGEPTA